MIHQPNTRNHENIIRHTLRHLFERIQIASNIELSIHFMHQGFWKAKWQSLSIFCGLYHYSGATEIPCGILSKSYLQLLNQVFVLITFEYTNQRYWMCIQLYWMTSNIIHPTASTCPCSATIRLLSWTDWQLVYRCSSCNRPGAEWLDFLLFHTDLQHNSTVKMY